MNIKEMMSGHWGDWMTFCLDSEISDIVVRVWGEGGVDPSYYWIVGSIDTDVRNGTVLILVPYDEKGKDYAIENYGVTLEPLSELLRRGLEIRPGDQDEEEDIES